MFSSRVLARNNGVFSLVKHVLSEVCRDLVGLAIRTSLLCLWLLADFIFNLMVKDPLLPKV